MDRNSPNIVLISNSKNHLAYLDFDDFSDFLGQFTIKCIIFQKGVDNFAIEHKTCCFFVRGVVSH